MYVFDLKLLETVFVSNRASQERGEFAKGIVEKMREKDPQWNYVGVFPLCSIYLDYRS